MRNFKIKYENLTGSNGNGEESVGRMSNTMNSDGVLISNADIGLMRSVLYIKSLRRQDLGVYKCKSSNAFGSRSVSVLIREKTLMGLSLNFLSIQKTPCFTNLSFTKY